MLQHGELDLVGSTQWLSVWGACESHTVPCIAGNSQGYDIRKHLLMYKVVL